jgi:hypothetical protein
MLTLIIAFILVGAAGFLLKFGVGIFFDVLEYFERKKK